MKIRRLLPVILLVLGIGLLLFTVLSGNSSNPVPGEPGEIQPPSAPPVSGSDSQLFTGIAGWITTAAGALLTAINFARSLSSSNPESRAMQIQTYIEKHPGCSESDLIKHLGYSRGSTAYHIRKLLREMRIAEKPYRNSIRYYPPVPQTAEEDCLHAVSAKEKPAVILAALISGPLTISELAEKTGFTASALRWHLSRMEEDGIVRSEKTGKQVTYAVRK